MADKLDRIARELAGAIQAAGHAAVWKNSLGPSSLDASGHYRDSLSLKHAGLLAGLGKIGRNSLLINEVYGNMIWMSAVLTSAMLEPDPPASYDI
ncbi:MAG: hypothetical protein Q8M76_04445 [Spirochaetaceae bacterium]|nr:hypothetical protein [Spirochaetaceae bacterium]